MAGLVHIGTLVGAIELQDKMSTALQRAEQQIDMTGNHVDKLSNSIVGLASSIEKTGGNIARIGDRLSILSAPIIAAGVAATKMSLTFEQSMTKIVTLAGTSVAQMHRMRDAVLELAPQTGRGPDELARALYGITSVGMHGAKAMDILKQSANAATIGMGESEDVARALVAALTAYGDTGLTASRAMDVLHMAVTEGGAEADQFANTLGRVIATAKLAGVSFEELVGSVATFTRLGVGADEAVTALRGTLSVLLKPSAEARQQLLSLGTSVEELRAKVKKDGLADALIDLIKLTKGNDDAIARIIPNVRALAGVLANASSQTDAYKNIVHLATITTGNFDRAVAVAAETGAVKLAKFWAQVDVLAIKMGDHLVPALISVTQAMQPLFVVAEKVVGAFSMLPQPIQTATVALVGFSLAIGPLMSIGGRVIEVVGMIIGKRGIGGLIDASLHGAGAFNKIGVALKLLTAAEVINGVVIFESNLTKLGSTLLMVGRGLGITGLVIALGSALYKVGEAIRDAKDAFDKGNLWEHLTARDTDNWVRRWLGLGDAAQQGAAGVQAGVAKALAAAANLETLQDRMQGLDLKNQVNELGLVYGKLAETGGLVPDVLIRIGNEAKNLADRGAVLPEFLARLVHGAEQVTLGAGAAARGLAPFSDAINNTSSALANLSKQTRDEMTLGALNFSMQEFLDKAKMMPEAARLSEEALKSFYNAAKENEKESKEGLKRSSDAAVQALKLWEEYETLKTAHSGTTTDAQIADIERWANVLAAKLGAKGKDTEDFYNALAALSKEKAREISADWDFIRNNSLQAAMAELARATNTMSEAMTSGLTFGRDQWEMMRNNIDVASEAVRNYGHAAVGANDAATEASKRHNSELQKTKQLEQEALEQAKIRQGWYTLDAAGKASPVSSMVMELTGKITPTSVSSKNIDEIRKQIAALANAAASFKMPDPFKGIIGASGTGLAAYKLYTDNLIAQLQRYKDQLAQVEYLQGLVSNFESSGGSSPSSGKGPGTVSTPRTPYASKPGIRDGGFSILFAKDSVNVNYPIMNDQNAKNQIVEMLGDAVVGKMKNRGVVIG